MPREYIVGRALCRIGGCEKEKVKRKHPSQPLCREHWNEYYSQYRLYNLERVREIHRLSRNKLSSDKKQQARDKANKAVRCALLLKRLKKLPCEVCDEKNTQAHHASYKSEDRLKVTWLCVACHAKWHREYESFYD